MLNHTLRLILAITLFCAAFLPDAALASQAASTRLEAAAPRAAPGAHIDWPPARPALRFWLPVRIVTASPSARPGWLLPARIVEADADRLALPPVRNLAAGVTDIRICTVDSGCEPGVYTDTLATDTPLVLYAASYDSGGFQNNEPVEWEVSSGAGVSPGTGVSTTLDGTLVGTVSVTATVIATPSISSNALFTITAGALATITVTPNPVTVTVGSTQIFTASGVDADGNPVSLAPEWAASAGEIDSSGVFTAPTEPASGQLVTATQETVFGTASVTVQANEPFSVTLQADPTSLTVGNASLLTAVVRDEFGNFVAGGTVVTFTTNLGGIISSTATFSGTATATTSSTQAGTATVSAASGSATSAPVSITFNPGLPFTLTLSPATAVISAGQGITYTVVATDVYGNRIGDVTANTTFATAPSAGVTISGNAITPTLKGTYTVTGTHTNGVFGTAALSVTPAAYTRLAIERPLGTEAAQETITLYDTPSYYAVRYDQFGNVIDTPMANWFGTGIIAGNLAPSTGISTTFTPAPIVSGTGVITASFGGITDATGTITVTAPTLRISKSDSPEPATPGLPLQYTVVYTNVGTATARGVVITETYPPSVTFFTSFPSPPINPPSNNVWSIPDLAPNTSETLQIVVNLPGEFPVGSTLTNTVRIGASKVATVPFTETTQVSSAPDLTISKVASQDPAHVGDNLNYTIEYRNDGTAPVNSIRITETYPSQVNYVTANPLPSSGQNVWLTNTLGGGGQSRLINVTVKVKSPLPDGTILDNQVTIDSNDTQPFTAHEFTVVGSPVLSLTQAANTSTPAANSVLTYTLRYTNSGTTSQSYASGGVVTGSVPLNTTYLGCAPGPCSQGGGIVSWTPGTVLGGTSGTLTMTVRVNNSLDNGTLLTSTARISSTEHVTAFASVTSTVSSAAALMLSKSDGVTSAAAGQVLTYSLVYTNAGNAPAHNTTITDRIPSNVTFQGCASCAQGSGLYTYTLNSVSAGASGVVTLSVRVSPTLPAGLRSITNTAGIRTTTPGDSPSDNQTQDVDAISTVPVLAIRAKFDASTPYPTKVITYSIGYTNTSKMHTIGVVISATQSAYVNYTPTGSSAWIWASGLVYTYPVGNLAAGASGLVTFVVSLPYPYKPGTTGFTNTFAIRDNGPGGLPVATTITTTLLGVPDLVIEKVITPDTVVVSQTFTATVVIRNQGTGWACNPKDPGGCGYYWIDAFVDPDIPPPSFPYSGDSKLYVAAPALNAGASVTVSIPISFTSGQDFILYFKVDNFGCEGDNYSHCSPEGAQHGLVPEGDEYNNVIGPVQLFRFRLYLPAIYKQYKQR